MGLITTVAMGARLLDALTEHCCCLCRTSLWELVLALQSCLQQASYQMRIGYLMPVAAAH